MTWTLLATTCTESCGCPPERVGDVVDVVAGPVKLPDFADVVYYAGISNLIKIGFSGYLKSRLHNLRPDVLLAIEPGGREVEQRRHEQFGHRRVHGEWFTPGADLLDHIEHLMQRYETPLAPRRCAPGEPTNPWGRHGRPST